MEFFKKLYDLLRHLGEDEKWRAMIDYVGTPTLYAILFVIVFCETGLVVTPILPGDSLLFAVGALSATGTAINVALAGLVFSVAAVLGDALNYLIGYKVGPKVFTSETNRFLNKKHLLRAQAFYEKH